MAFRVDGLGKSLDRCTATKPREEVIRTLYGYRRALRDDLVLLQSNRFIKELLHSQELAVGQIKNAFRQSLYEAIEHDLFDINELYNWMHRVEGWGNQFVYVYRLAQSVRDRLPPDGLARRVFESQLDKLWPRPDPFAFPPERRLTSILYPDSGIEMTWHQVWSQGTKRRIVTRFQADLARGFAAIFIPAEFGADEHRVALAQVRATVGRLVDLSLWTPASSSEFASGRGWTATKCGRLF